MITQNTIDKIFDAVHIEDVVGEYVTLKRRGSNMMGLCPFHNEKTPSFVVSPGKNIYKCFGCGQAGNSVKFLMEHENFNYPEALKHLAERYRIEIEETKLSQGEKDRKLEKDSFFVINEYAAKYYVDYMLNNDIGKSVGLGYFKSRGYLETTIEKFQLGYASNERDGFTKYAVEQGFDIKLMKELGLTSASNYDFFRNRVMFPIHNISGKVIGFGGRILVKNEKAPKYLNSPESKVYFKSKILYGLYQSKTAIRKKDECLLVEGYTDVISLHQGGVDNVVSSSGTSLTDGQLSLVKRFTNNLKILFDGDSAGIRAALRGVDLALEHDLNLKIVILPDNEDPDSYMKLVGFEKFTQYLDENAKDFILFKLDHYKFDTLTDPIKKSEAIKDIIQSIAKIPDLTKRSIYVQTCSQRLNMREEVLLSETNKAIQKLHAEKERSAQRDQRQKERNDRRQNEQRQNTSPSPSPADISESPYSLMTGEDEEDVGIPGDEPMIQDIPDNLPNHLADSPNKRIDQHSFQEKDVIRLLFNFGNKVLLDDEKTTVCTYILDAIGNILPEVNDTNYKFILEECYAQYQKSDKIDLNKFLNHKDNNIASVCVDIISERHSYSDNWEKLYEITLQTQPVPEQNIKEDTIQGIDRFLLKKLDKMCLKNQKAIGNEKDTNSIMKLLTFQQSLLEQRNAIALKLKTTIIK